MKTLEPIYANLYNRIARPDQQFTITQYFLQQWVPLLGGELAWLVVALRERCHEARTGDGWGQCLTTHEELAAEIGVRPQAIPRLLRHEHAGKFLQVEGDCYLVRLDEPMTPEDEARCTRRSPMQPTRR